MKLSKYTLLIYEQDHLLLFNTLSQALLFVEKKNADRIKRFFESLDSVHLSEKEMEKLKKGMFVLDDSFNEIEYLRFRFNSYRYSDRFLRYTVVLTHACNFDCVYCYQKLLHHVADVSKTRAVLSKAVEEHFLKNVEKRMREQKPNLLSVTFYGGEPLLCHETLTRMSGKLKKLCESLGVEYDSHVLTNGYLLTKEVVNSLAESGIKFVEITLDGTKAFHDRYRKTKKGGLTYDVIFKNLEYAARRLFVQIRVNISAENAESVKELIDEIAERRLKVEFNFQPVEIVEGLPMDFHDTPLDPKEFAKVEAQLWWYVRKRIPEYPFEYFKKPRLARCDAMCKNSFVVDVDGKVYKCWGELGMPLASGFLKENGIELNPFYLKWLTYDPFDDEECKNCLVFPFCMGGCAFNTVVYKILGESSVQKPHRCISLRYNLKEFVRIIADYKLKGVKRDGISERTGSG